MKVLALILITAASAFAQVVPKTGFQPTGTKDTVKCIFLLSKCDTCQSRATSGLMQRERYVYFGDRTVTGAGYSDKWVETAALNQKGIPVPASWIIWSFRILEPKIQ